MSSAAGTTKDTPEEHHNAHRTGRVYTIQVNSKLHKCSLACRVRPSPEQTPASRTVQSFGQRMCCGYCQNLPIGFSLVNHGQCSQYSHWSHGSYRHGFTADLDHVDGIIVTCSLRAPRHPHQISANQKESKHMQRGVATQVHAGFSKKNTQDHKQKNIPPQCVSGCTNAGSSHVCGKQP